VVKSGGRLEISLTFAPMHPASKSATSKALPGVMRES
jgi:hypothetical protein